MGKVIAGMTLSLDGFVNDRTGSVASLYSDFDELGDILQESIHTTGAVVMGCRTFEMGDPDSYADTYEYQVPIFVVTHHAPEHHPRESDRLTFTFVTEGVENAIQQAKAAARDRNVTVVGGASTIQQALRAGLVDQLHVDIMPVLLGQGLRLFDHLTEEIRLEKLKVSAGSQRTMLQFRVVR